MQYKFVENKSINKMTQEELAKNTGDKAIKNKDIILSYMTQFPPCAFTSQPVIDKFTGKTVFDANNARSDGVYTWYESEIYHFEHYNLKLNDDFIEHVLNQINK